MSLIQDNLMNREGYSPYCGDCACSYRMPRTFFKNDQFECKCGFRTDFTPEFIAEYKKKWKKP